MQSLKPKDVPARRNSDSSKPRDSRSTLDRLLDAALIEFGEHGFSGARVDEIAKRAKANKQLVYHYFGSKEDLYTAVLEGSYLRFRGDEAALRKQIEGVDAETALRQLIDYLFGRSPPMRYFQRLVQDENVQCAKHLLKLPHVVSAYHRLVAIVGEILDRGVAEGRFRPGIDASEFYISIVGMFTIRITNAATLSAATHADLNSVEGNARSHAFAVDLLLRGIEAR